MFTKFPWKKNFMKIPKDIKAEVDKNSDKYLKVSESKKILKEEIRNGLYKHLQIEENQNEIEFPSSILPREENGRFSKYNMKGRDRVLKDKPKTEKTFEHEAPNFGGYKNGSHIVSWTRMVWQREYWFPLELTIDIDLVEVNENDVSFIFTVNSILDPKSDVFEHELLFSLNLLQENTGVSNVYPTEATKKDYLDRVNVDWELLPLGESNKEKNLNKLVDKFNVSGKDIEEKIKDRLDFFESLNPVKLVYGSGGFSRYFGAEFSDGKVLLENLNYGNAIYIFFRNGKN